MLTLSEFSWIIPAHRGLVRSGTTMSTPTEKSVMKHHNASLPTPEQSYMVYKYQHW
jgi:hypothetical protein